MEALHRMPDGDIILPFVLQFYGRLSTHLWEDEEGVVREIQQGEGGEQGDPLMPPLFALGQHWWQFKRRCGPVRDSSLSMTCTSFPSQNRHCRGVIGGQALEARQDLDQSGENSSLEQVRGDTT